MALAFIASKTCTLVLTAANDAPAGAGVLVLLSVDPLLVQQKGECLDLTEPRQVLAQATDQAETIAAQLM